MLWLAPHAALRLGYVLLNRISGESCFYCRSFIDFKLFDSSGRLFFERLRPT